jgi:hypothetical protein
MDLMPIANCIVNNFGLPLIDYQLVVNEWADEIPTKRENITLSFIAGSQYGNKYKMLVNLYLPSVWKSGEVERIQLTLLNTLIKHLNLNKEEIFVLTSIIHSGHVVENGEIQNW